MFGFKRIVLEDDYVSKNLRALNTTINNGMIIMATIFDEKEGYHISKAYEKKGIFCNCNALEGVIDCLD